MLQSSALADLDDTLSPVNARALTNATMTTVATSEPLEATYTSPGITSYTARDQELLERDLTVASYISQIALQLATIWNAEVDTLVIPVIPSSTLDYRTSDLNATPATPANVAHVQNSSHPVDAITSDQTLYARDAIIYEMLARISFLFAEADRLLDPLDSAITIDNTWSRAKANGTYADVSISAPYNRDLFFGPDRYLAHRDNVLAYHAANVNQFAANIFEGAERLLLRASATRT